MNSQTALVNGKKKTMSTAPRVIKNEKTKTSYVYVPGNFVATNLGFDYTWNSTTKTSVISTKSSSNSNNSTTGDSTPSTGVSGVYGRYSLLSKYTDSYNSIVNSSVKDLTYAATATLANLQSIKESATTLKDGVAFTITADNKIQSVKSSKDGLLLKVVLGNTYTVSQSNSYANNLVTGSTSVFNQSDNTTTVALTLSDSKLNYQLKMSEDQKQVTIEVYCNYITSVAAGKDSAGDYLKVQTMHATTPSLSVDANNTLNILLQGAFNGVGAQEFDTPGSNAISIVTLNNTVNNSTELSVKMLDDTAYSLEQVDTTTFLVRFTNDSTNDAINNGDDDDNNDLGNLEDFQLLIPYPGNVKISNITDADDYLNNRFQIKIPGNYVTYYKNNPITVNSSKIKSTSVAYQNSYTVITVNTSSICGYRYSKKDGYLCVVVDKPNKIYNKIVVLDPGHGGSDTGATHNGVYEKTLNFKILHTYVSELFKEDDHGIKVYYTRTTDVKPSLYERQAFSSTVGADLFVSLHMNSASATSASGTEVWYYSGNTAKMGGLTSKTMATAFCNNLVKVMNSTNRGVKSNGFVVIKNTVPAVLIELGFISNPTDFNKLTSTTYQKKAAQSIYDTIVDLFEQYSTGR